MAQTVQRSKSSHESPLHIFCCCPALVYRHQETAASTRNVHTDVYSAHAYMQRRSHSLVAPVSVKQCEYTQMSTIQAQGKDVSMAFKRRWKVKHERDSSTASELHQLQNLWRRFGHWYNNSQWYRCVVVVTD